MYIAKRVGQAIITALGVVSFTFFLIRFMPGGPMDYLRALMYRNNPGASTERVNRYIEIHAAVAPDEPIYIQYLDYLLSVLTGDFGVSVWYNEPVANIILRSLPWTLLIMTIATFITFTLAITLGSILGYKEGTRFDSILSTISIILNSIPFYIAGILMLFTLGYQHNLFPTGGNHSVDPGWNITFLVDLFHHATLPILSYVLTSFGLLALIMRGNCIQIMGNSYIRVAELRGLRERTISLKYVGRNAVLPLYTELMISIGFMFGGSIILEEIFRYPGLGFYMFKAIEARDHPLMMGTFIVITLAVIIGVLIADLTYGWIDPRAGRDETQ